MTKKVNLHATGIDFLRYQLRAGDYLAQALLDQPLDSGMAFTFLPESVDVNRLSLKEGGMNRFEFDDDLTEPFLQFAKTFQKLSPLHLMLFELGTAERARTCPWDRREFSTVTCHGSLHRMFRGEGYREEVAVDSFYGFVASPNQDAVAGLFQYARPFPTVGVLASMPDLSSVAAAGTQIREGSFETLAQSTQHIMVDAFDGEAYLIWSRRASGA